MTNSHNTTSIVPIVSTREGYVLTSAENVYIKVVVVHGSIGAGKTTILTKIERHGFKVLYEDLDSWRNVKGHNLLEEYYKDPSRLAYVFQSEIVRSRYRQFMELINDKEWLSASGPDTMEFGHLKIKVVFTERDHLSSLRVFSKRLLDSKMMLPVEYAHMELWCEMLGMPVSRNVFYLSPSPEECMDRIHKRDRPEEKKGGVDISLLAGIDQYYLQWLKEDYHLQVTYIPSFKLDDLNRQVQMIVQAVKR
jgi:deoxyadenosine/deoxycytidine kinase